MDGEGQLRQPGGPRGHGRDVVAKGSVIHLPGLRHKRDGDRACANVEAHAGTIDNGWYSPWLVAGLSCDSSLAHSPPSRPSIRRETPVAVYISSSRSKSAHTSRAHAAQFPMPLLLKPS